MTKTKPKPKPKNTARFDPAMYRAGYLTGQRHLAERILEHLPKRPTTHVEASLRVLCQETKNAAKIELFGYVGREAIETFKAWAAGPKRNEPAHESEIDE